MHLCIFHSCIPYLLAKNIRGGQIGWLLSRKTRLSADCISPPHCKRDNAKNYISPFGERSANQGLRFFLFLLIHYHTAVRTLLLHPASACGKTGPTSVGERARADSVIVTGTVRRAESSSARNHAVAQ